MNGWIEWRKSACAVGLCAFACAGAQAATIDWNQWTSATGGSISPDGVTVTYTPGGPTDNLVLGYPSYTPTSTFADGSIVANAPVSSDNIIQLTGGNDNLNTITFSKPVVNPVMAIWSLGQGGSPASFNFTDATPTFVAGGPSAEYGGSAITVAGDVVSGAEGNGTVEFIGTFTSISWTNPAFEYWYGFDVGIAGTAGPSPVPEPATLGLLALGLAGVGVGVAKRKRKS